MADDYEFQHEADDMPSGQDRLKTHGRRGHRAAHRNSSRDEAQDSSENDKRRNNRRERPLSSFRKAFRGNDASDQNSMADMKKQDEILRHELSTSLEDYSRQRLRSLHMTLRQYSTDVSRVSVRDLTLALQDANIRIPGRILHTLTEKFEDNRGIDLEGLYNFITNAHSKTGRDSVMAMRKRNDLAAKHDVSQHEVDEDLLWRVESLLVQSHSYINIDALRNAFQGRDVGKTGKIDASVVRQVCTDQHMPVFGALLKNLIKRCDEGNNGKISWPEFLSFLERAQENAWITSPELKELPEKLKSQTPVAPSPIDELSSRTRNALVNKLRKKSSIKKPEPDVTDKASQEPQSEPKETTHPKTNDAIGQQTNDVIDKETAVPVREPEVTTTADDQADTQTTRVKEKVSTDTKIQQKVDDKHADDQEAQDEKMDGHTNPPQSEEQAEVDAKKNPTLNTTRDVQPEPETTTTYIPSNSNIRCKNGAVHVTVRGKEIEFPVPPSFQLTQTVNPPNERLRLLWVYGYRGNDCRKNIHVLLGGEIIYFISNVAILYHRHAHRQRHYREHTDDIKCLDVHRNGLMAATGQFASRKKPNVKAHVRVWRTDTLQTLNVLGVGGFERCVFCVAFSAGKDYLAAVDNSQYKKMMVWNTSTGEAIGEALLGTDLVCDLGFNPKDPETLVTIGKEHTSWWKVYEESRMIQSLDKPDYETFLRAKFVICMTFTSRGDLITGDSNGTIYIWGDGGKKITNYVKHAHDGPVFTVLWNKGYVVSGGRDGIIHCWQWNKAMDKAGFLQIPKLDGGVRMLQIQGQTLLIGTTMNAMISATLAKSDHSLNGAVLDDVPITQGHYDDLRGLAVMVPRHSSSSVHSDIVTAGQDGIICTYDSATCRTINKLQFKRNQFTCVDKAANEDLFCLGTKIGHIQLVEQHGEFWGMTLDQKVGKDRICTIRFSPDARLIAAGSSDTYIYLFRQQTKDDNSVAWVFLGKLKGHSGAVSGLDWSSEQHDLGQDCKSYLLKSSSTSLENKLWNPYSMEELADRDLLSVTTSSRTCVVDLNVAGILAGKHVAGTDVHTLDVNTSGSLVAMGDNGGCLSLFRYPCVSNCVFCHSYKGHESFQTVRFSPCSNYVFTVGGRDSCLMQWELV